MKITEAFMKDVLAQYSQDEISFSRMVELLNEEAKRDMTASEAASAAESVEESAQVDQLLTYFKAEEESR